MGTTFSSSPDTVPALTTDRPVWRLVTRPPASRDDYDEAVHLPALQFVPASAADREMLRVAGHEGRLRSHTVSTDEWFLLSVPHGGGCHLHYVVGSQPSVQGFVHALLSSSLMPCHSSVSMDAAAPLTKRPRRMDDADEKVRLDGSDGTLFIEYTDSLVLDPRKLAAWSGRQMVVYMNTAKYADVVEALSDVVRGHETLKDVVLQGPYPFVFGKFFSLFDRLGADRRRPAPRFSLALYDCQVTPVYQVISDFRGERPYKPRSSSSDFASLVLDGVQLGENYQLKDWVSQMVARARPIPEERTEIVMYLTDPSRMHPSQPYRDLAAALVEWYRADAPVAHYADGGVKQPPEGILDVHVGPLRSLGDFYLTAAVSALRAWVRLGAEASEELVAVLGTGGKAWPFQNEEWSAVPFRLAGLEVAIDPFIHDGAAAADLRRFLDQRNTSAPVSLTFRILHHRGLPSSYSVDAFAALLRDLCVAPLRGDRASIARVTFIDDQDERWWPRENNLSNLSAALTAVDGEMQSTTQLRFVSHTRTREPGRISLMNRKTHPRLEVRRVVRAQQRVKSHDEWRMRRFQNWY